MVEVGGVAMYHAIYIILNDIQLVGLLGRKRHRTIVNALGVIGRRYYRCLEQQRLVPIGCIRSRSIVTCEGVETIVCRT